MNRNGRVAVCGAIATYNAKEPAIRTYSCMNTFLVFCIQSCAYKKFNCWNEVRNFYIFLIQLKIFCGT